MLHSDWLCVCVYASRVPHAVDNICVALTILYPLLCFCDHVATVSTQLVLPKSCQTVLAISEHLVPGETGCLGYD
jgi:hypothetical protein